MVGWRFTWDSTYVELPEGAIGDVTDDNPADINESKNPGNLPWVIGLGRKGRKLTTEGLLYVAGQTRTQLKTTYLDPLRGRIGKTVVLSQSELYDGTWVVENVVPKLKRGFAQSMELKIVLVQGSNYIIL